MHPTMASQRISDRHQREAERIRDTGMREKLFWLIDKEDHFEDLQLVLDVLYNPDNDACYEPEVVQQQSGRRLNVKCKACNVLLSSYDPFVSHDRGKAHKKKVHLQKSEENEFPNLIGKLEVKAYDKVENNFEEGSLEDELFRTSFRVLGCQFIYKEENVYGEEFFSCQLCRKLRTGIHRVGQRSAMNHIIADEHILEYMYRKFGRSGAFSSGDMQDEINRKVEEEGKIQCKITKLSAVIEEKQGRTRHSKYRSDQSEKDSRQKHAEDTVKKENKDPQPAPQTWEEFMQDIDKHCIYLQKLQKEEGKKSRNENEKKTTKLDCFTERLKTDVDANDLIIRLVKVLSQKMVLYGRENDPTIEAYAERLLQKADYLRLPMLEKGVHETD